MPTVDFLPFATGGGAGVVSQATYAGLSAVSNGFSTGTAFSNQLNKVWRQSSFMSAVVANFMANQTGLNVLDDGDLSGAVTKLTNAIKLSIAGTVPLFGGTSTGTADALAFATTPTFASYVAGQRVWGFANATNLTTTPTANFNAIGAVNLKDEAGAALAIGDIQNGKLYEFYVFSPTEIRLTADVNDPVTLSGAQTIVGAKTFSSAIQMSAAPINFAVTTNVPSVAGTTNLDTMTSNVGTISGTNVITGITLTDGRVRVMQATGAFGLTAGGSLVVQGVASGATYTATVGDLFIFEAYGSVINVRISKMGVGSVGSGTRIIAAGNMNTGGDTTISVPAGSWSRIKAHIVGLRAASDYSAFVRVNADTGSNYRYSLFIVTDGGTTASQGSSSATGFSVTDQTDLVDDSSTTQNPVDFSIEVANPAGATNHKDVRFDVPLYRASSGVFNTVGINGGRWLSAAAITSLSVLLRNTAGASPSGSTINASAGTWYMVGG